MFKTHVNTYGIYIVSIFYNGVKKSIIVDDIIPCYKDSNQPIYTKADGNNIWPLILEKVWVKLIGGYH